MAKFHMAKDGRAAQCNAVKQACPLGAETPHGEFDSAEAAQAWAEDALSKQYAIVSEAMKKVPPAVKRDYYCHICQKRWISTVILQCPHCRASKDEVQDMSGFVEPTKEQKDRWNAMREERWAMQDRRDQEEEERRRAGFDF